MITVSILSTEEKLIVRLKHHIEFVAEKNFGRTQSFNQRTTYLFYLLFFSFTKMILKEAFMRSH